MGNLLDFYKDDARFIGKVNLNVIEFIDSITNFPDRKGNIGEHIDHLFCAGYCYYFAHMLKLAFGGRVCWVENRSHIVWADCDINCSLDALQEAVAYDITGVFDDYERIWPAEYLGETIVDFMHNGKEFHLSDTFKEWCDSLDITESYAVAVIWKIIPLDEIKEAYKECRNMVQTVYQYYCKYDTKLASIIRFCREDDCLTLEHRGADYTFSYIINNNKFDVIEYLQDYQDILPPAAVADCVTKEDCDALLSSVGLPLSRE